MATDTEKRIFLVGFAIIIILLLYSEYPGLFSIVAQDNIILQEDFETFVEEDTRWIFSTTIFDKSKGTLIQETNNNYLRVTTGGDFSINGLNIPLSSNHRIEFDCKLQVLSSSRFEEYCLTIDGGDICNPIAEFTGCGNETFKKVIVRENTDFLPIFTNKTLNGLKFLPRNNHIEIDNIKIIETTFMEVVEPEPNATEPTTPPPTVTPPPPEEPSSICGNDICEFDETETGCPEDCALKEEPEPVPQPPEDDSLDAFLIGIGILVIIILFLLLRRRKK